MFQKNIVLKSSEDVKKLVHAAEKCEFEIDLSYNHIFIDAKSILGVMGLGLSRVLTVSYPKENHKFEKVLGDLKVA